MNTLIAIWLGGMPISLGFLIWAFWGAPSEDLIEVGTLSGVAAVAVFVLLWPLFIALSLYDAWMER